MAECRHIFVVEGEGCVDRLGPAVTATTNAGGALHWTDEHTEALRGADVVVLPDNDDPGHQHGELVARALHGVASRVRVLHLPDLPPKGDVVDWMAAGGTREKLERLTEAAPVWTPVSVSSEWEKPIPFSVVSDPVPFPDDALPADLYALARDIADVRQVDISAPAVLIPATISAAAGNVFSVKVKETYTEPCLSRYAALVMPSGSRKTATFRDVSNPLDVWTESDRLEYGQRVARANADRAVQDERRKSLERMISKEDDPGAHERLMSELYNATEACSDGGARPPRVYVSDATTGALVRHMAAAGGGFAVLSGDARHIADGLLGQHRRDSSTDDTVYLAAHGGDLIDRSRVGNDKGGEYLCIPHPALALAIAVQPDKLAALARRPELLTSGFIPRCNIVQPHVPFGHRLETGDDPPPNHAVRERWRHALGAILDARFGLIDAGPSWQRIVLHLGPDAREAWMSYANEMEIRLADGGDLAGARAFASKAAAEAVRVAALLHLCSRAVCGGIEHAADIPIDALTFRIAEQHQRWCLHETLRCLRVARENDVDRVARAVLEWASAKPGERRIVTGSNLVAAHKVDTVKDAETVLRRLQELLWCHNIGPEDGRSVQRWEVHPDVFSNDKEVQR